MTTDRTARGRSRVVRIVAVIAVLWLVIGALAALQRGYYGSAKSNCASVGTILVTIVAGPLNYVGANPKVTDCPNVPQPSK